MDGLEKLAVDVLGKVSGGRVASEDLDARRRDEVAARIRDFVIVELIGRPGYPLGDTELLVGGGLIDSFTLVRLSVFIEEAFGVYVAATDLGPAGEDTIAGMVARICRAEGSA